MILIHFVHSQTIKCNTAQWTQYKATSINVGMYVVSFDKDELLASSDVFIHTQS